MNFFSNFQTFQFFQKFRHNAALSLQKFFFFSAACLMRLPTRSLSDHCYFDIAFFRLTLL